MNQLALLIGSYLAIASQQNPTAPNTNSLAEWESYKAQYGKQYDNETVEAVRRSIFAQNKQQIDQFNLSPKAENFSLGLNHLADLSEAELISLNGFKLPRDNKKSPRNSPNAEKFINEILNDKSIEVPDELDWRKTPGRVSRVKDQGKCGSCWAFATTGLLEGQELLRSNGTTMVALSEQNLIDCVDDDNGCQGGIMSDALDAIADEGGIDDEKSYPYEAKQRNCRFKKDKVAFNDVGYAILPMGREDKLREIVAKYGPVSVAIQARKTLVFYKDGVYYDELCSADGLNHAVLVVGYGTDPKGGDYWLVKNSWGEKWGESGYVKMARNRGNNCGIATYPIVATF